MVEHERRVCNYPGEGKRYHIRFDLNKLVERNSYLADKDFKNIIEKIGGYVYNVCVGRMESGTIFNGSTWLSFESAESFEDSEGLFRKFQEAAKAGGYIPEEVRC